MKQQTFEARLVAGLVALGWTEERGVTRKYRVFTKGNPENRFFVGPSGALRLGKCATDSRSAGCPSGFQSKAWHLILTAGDKALGVSGETLTPAGWVQVEA